MEKNTNVSSGSPMADLEAAARDFDRVDYAPRFARAPALEQRRHAAALRQAKRNRGRPAIGAGAKRVQITVEGSLLAEADNFARHQQITRSELVARGLRLAMAS